MARQRDLGEWALRRWHIATPDPQDLQAEAAKSEYEDEDLTETDGGA